MTHRTFGLIVLAAMPHGRHGDASAVRDAPWAVPPGSRRIGRLRDAPQHTSPAGGPIAALFAPTDTDHPAVAHR